MAELLRDVPVRALAIYAHPDDCDVSCGGTLAAWAAAGCEVTVVICTDGGKGSTDPGVVPAELAAIRQHEALQAGEVLGVAKIEFLAYPDGEVADDSTFQGRLVELVRRYRPEIVLAPDPSALFFGQEYVNHRDHRIVGMGVLDAVAPAAAMPHYFPEVGPPHQVDSVLLSGTLEVDVWVEITKTVEQKGRAVACHRSQFPDGEAWAATAVRMAAEDGGREAGVAFAEGFRRLRLGG